MATRIWYPISPLLAASIRYLHDKDLPEEGPHQRVLYVHHCAFRLQQLSGR